MTVSNQQSAGRTAIRTGTAIAMATSFLIVWTTIVRDNGQGAGFFLIVMAAAVAAFAARFEPAGIARGLAGIAAMQLAWALTQATAPVVMNVPGEAMRAMVAGGVFAALWLAAATCFRAASSARDATLTD